MFVCSSHPQNHKHKNNDDENADNGTYKSPVHSSLPPIKGAQNHAAL
jgi:hypothetical protein